MKLGRSIRIVFAVLGVGLFALLVWRVGPAKLAQNIRECGWGLWAIIGVGAVSHLVKTWAWRFTFAREHRTMSFVRMLKIRLAGEAVSQISFAGQVFGETTRALMMKSDMPMVRGVSSVVLDRGMYTFTSVLLIVFGALLSCVALRLSETVQIYDMIAALALLGFAWLMALTIHKRWPLLSFGLRALGRIGAITSWAENKRTNVQQIETTIYSFHQERRHDFWCAFGLNLCGHAFSILEVYLVLFFLSTNLTLLDAFFIEVLTKLVNIGGAIIPGNYGVSEGGNMLILRTLGLGATTGLTLAIARRLRGLFWAGVGLIVLVIHGLRHKPEGGVTELSLHRHEQTI